jgi:hypothetical protein
VKVDALLCVSKIMIVSDWMDCAPISALAAMLFDEESKKLSEFPRSFNHCSAFCKKILLEKSNSKVYRRIIVPSGSHCNF